MLLSSVALPPSYPTFKKKSVLPSGLTLEILSFVVSDVHWSSVYHCIVKSPFVIFSNSFVDSLYLYTTLPLLLTTFSISKTLLFPILVSSTGTVSPLLIQISSLLVAISTFTFTLGWGKTASPKPVVIFESGLTLVGTLLPPIYLSRALTVIVVFHSPVLTFGIVWSVHLIAWVLLTSS